MTKYLTKVKDQIHYFSSCNFQGIDRSDNTVADALARLTMIEASSFSVSVYLEIFDAPSVHKLEVLALDRLNCWLTPYIEYLNDGILPTDRVLVKKIKHKSSNFLLIDGDLYRRAFSSPLLKCLTPSKADYVLQEVHKGICGDHMGTKALTYKV